MNDSNDSKNSLDSERILNFLNHSLQDALLLVAAIILMIFLGCKILLSGYSILSILAKK
jgi:hypothetical protein